MSTSTAGVLATNVFDYTQVLNVDPNTSYATYPSPIWTQCFPITTTSYTTTPYTPYPYPPTQWINTISPLKIDLSEVSSEDLMKEVLRRGAFKTIKEYRDKK